MIGAVIVRERDGKAYHVLERDGDEYLCKPVTKPGDSARKIRVAEIRIGAGHGFTVAEPSEQDLARAETIIRAAKVQPVTAYTRRGNYVTVRNPGDCFEIVAHGRVLYRNGFDYAATHKLACWGAKFVS